MLSSQSSDSLSAHVANARLVYDGRVLFDGLEATLPAGQWTCLLGPTGVGKSSLLRLIAGLAPADRTTRVTCGDGGPVAGRAAYMAQQDLLLPWLSVLDNVTLGDRLRGHRPAREPALRLLERVGLAERAGAYPASLSGGMRQRVALARTLMENRPIVLMDEPFSALDAITRYRVQGLAVQLLYGRTVLLVTHDPLEALRLGDRIHVMAGAPAHIDEALTPPGAPPRDPADPALLALQAELLARLSVANGDAG